MASFMEHLTDTISIDKEKCIFCGECVERCLLDNIRIRIAPCRRNCPLGTNCQGYAQLIARGEFEHAARVLRAALPFPGIIGRICPHPCETACARNDVDGQGVALRELKRFLADHVFDYTDLPRAAAEKQQCVAVVGGGPAGMMAAYQLRALGYQVEIFESGGMLGGAAARYIPQFRLPLQVVAKESAQLLHMGVKVHYHTTVGRDVTMDRLRRDYGAVILATGCGMSRRLGVAGEDAENVYGALSFLAAAKQDAPAAVGRNVVVIGGGNTAVDAAETALRLGAEDVRMVCLEAREEMPAFAWELQDALAEGVIIENKWGPAAFETEHGRVTRVRLRKCLSVFDADGNFAPLFAEQQEKTLAADTVIIAVGQQPDRELVERLGVACAHGLITADGLTMQTSVENIFAAGDAATGPKTAIEAIAQGREAAESVHRYLSALSLTYGRKAAEAGRIYDFAIDGSHANAVPRVMPRKNGAKTDFQELTCGITREQAQTEASRCLSCGAPFGMYKTCWECLACEVECQQDALEIHVPYLMR